jgi:hypothetical protein
MHRLLVPVFCFWTLLFPASALAPAQNLTKITVQFSTGNDDKDDDTKVTYSFVVNGQAVAQLRDFAGDRGRNDFPFKAINFKNKTLSPVFEIPVLRQVPKQQIQTGKTEVIIRPNGNDTWRFDLYVTFQYSNGQTERKEYKAIELSEKRNRGEWSY